MRNFIGTKRIHPAILAVAALLIIALTAVPTLMAHRGHDSAHPVTPSPAPSTSPSPVPSGAVTLAPGSRLADGLWTGYPHTTLGAISAAAEYLDAVASTLDPDYAASVMRAVGDPANSTLPSSLAESAFNLRSDLRLPSAGPLNPPIAFQTTAQMYQLRDASADSVLVLLLASGTFTNAQGGIAQTSGVFPVHMRWVGNDWKLTAIGGGQDYSELNATPDTSAAVSQGWSSLIAPLSGGGS